MSTAYAHVRLIAFYLPQFHAIPENDEWWGKGFTEWRNVVQAKPLFPGHYQPHLPADLGFYDLRLPEVRQAQADLAREYGIDGFCYYHYWFKGKRLLERPFNEILASGKPDLPFCLCWVNESWTRSWDGRSGEYLLKQEYSEEDDRHHMRWLTQAFRDQRYMRIQDKPIYLVYRAASLPNPLKTTTIWREEARRHGIGEIFLCRVESFPDERTDPRGIGFDAAVEFQPDWVSIETPLQRNLFWRVARKIGLSSRLYAQYKIYDYLLVVEKMLQKTDIPYIRFPCVMPSWDNSARVNRGGVIIKGATPDLYERWLKTIVQRVERSNASEKIVFINAWNEWAEGCHLEPDLRYGRAYLEATKRALG